MKKLAIRFGLMFLTLLSTTVISGCDALSSSTNTTLTPPSSEYLADIIGRVTIISNSAIKAGKTLPTPNEGSQFWVVQLFVKNKGYPAPINFDGSLWYIEMPSAPLHGFEEVGMIPGWIGGSSATIPQGQTGEVTLLFIVSPGMRQTSTGGIFFDVKPDPKDCRLRYIGFVPQGSANLQKESIGSLVSTAKVVGVYDWDSQRILQAAVPASVSPNRPISPIPFGTYVAETAFGNASLTLNSDGTYAATGGFMGKDVGTYIISSNQITLRSANPSVGPDTQSYTYSDQFKCLYMGNDPRSMIPYYRR